MLKKESDREIERTRERARERERERERERAREKSESERDRGTKKAARRLTEIRRQSLRSCCGKRVLGILQKYVGKTRE
jgi:hypothetical protein